jgi:hypothetical protein
VRVCKRMPAPPPFLLIHPSILLWTVFLISRFWANCLPLDIFIYMPVESSPVPPPLFPSLFLSFSFLSLAFMSYHKLHTFITWMAKADIEQILIRVADLFLGASLDGLPGLGPGVLAK